MPSHFTLTHLHAALQVAFGWQDSHLHEYRVGDERYGVPDHDDDELLDEAAVTLVLSRKSKRPQHPQMRERVDADFDPERCVPAEINRRLARIA